MKLKMILAAITLALINNEVVTWAVLAAAGCYLILRLAEAMEKADSGNY